MKKILVVGASNYQVPAIQRVRQLGYEAYCVDYKEGQPGFTHANGYQIIDVKDKVCLNFSLLSIVEYIIALISDINKSTGCI